MNDSSASYKTFRRGTHRCASPTETLERIKKFLPIFGITRVGNITGLDTIGIPVVTVTRPNSRSLAVSQGKGHSLACAKISGIMESIETYHAERFFVPGLFVSWDDLAYRYPVIDISAVSRSRIKNFESHSKIYWNKGFDLLNDRETWLPYELVHTDYTMESFHSGFFIADTNGLASGNTRQEAINHALCEVIERDALALWVNTKEEKQHAEKIDPASIDDKQCQDLIEKLYKANVDFGIWDITTDIGAPTFICKIISKDNGVNAVRPVYGSGCHLNKNVALSRAITEAAQSRVCFIAGARDDQYRSVYNEHLSREFMDSWRDEICGTSAIKDFATCCNFESDTLDDDFDYLADRLREKNIKQIVCVDLTREEFSIPVVKVIVPGLESVTSHEERIYGTRMHKHIAGQSGDSPSWGQTP